MDKKLFSFFVCALVGMFFPVDITAQNTDTLFVYLNNSDLYVFPPGTVVSQEDNADRLTLRVVGDTTIVYEKSDLRELSQVGPQSLPAFTSFKFSSKQNDQLTVDADCDISGDRLTASVGSIGKWLTPSFNLTSDDAQVWIGNKQQYSKKTRINFAQPVELTVAMPRQFVYGSEGFGHYGRTYTANMKFLADDTGNFPRIDINIEDGKMVSSKDYYLHAQIIFDGKGMYPSMTEQVDIKGRGNSSWSSNPWDKNPYRLKFKSKVKPFGLTKGKSWVLLANKQYHSMMTNAVGMKIANLIGLPGANHVIPVELYINGNYRGNYNFTEKVGFSNNSINLPDESRAVMLELDQYYDEVYKFHSSDYYLPVMVHDPDLDTDDTALTLDDIKNDFNAFAHAVKVRDAALADYVDVESLAKFMMLNELILNYEIIHPKSTFLYKDSVGEPGHKWIFGPAWDFDWAFGYEHQRDYCTGEHAANFWKASNFEAQNFWLDLRYGNEEIEKAYYKVWYEFINNNQLDELIDYIDAYYNFTRVSFYNNDDKWRDGADYRAVSDLMKGWLKYRAQYIFRNLKVYDIDDDTSGIGISTMPETDADTRVDVYNLQGVRVKADVRLADIEQSLPQGIYIANGKKFVVR